MKRLVLAACLLATASTGAALAQSPFPVTPKTVVLANGLELLLAPDPQATAVDVAVWYDAGTRHEKEGALGVAHLFEHLMFRGSEHYGPQQHWRTVIAEGGTFGAFTTADFTCFHQTLPPEDLELAFRLEADRMTRLSITDPALDFERAAVREERARRFESSAVGRGLQRLYATAFDTHPYRRALLGEDRDLARLTLAQARAWYAERYGPGRAVITVVGRFDPADAEAKAKAVFGALPGGRKGAAAAIKPAAQERERRAREVAESPAPIVLVGWRGPGQTDPDAALLPLLAAALARGDDARLPRDLVRGNRGLRSVQADVESRRDASLLYAVGAVSPDADTSEVEGALVEAVEKLAAEPLSPDELARVKTLVESGTLYSWQTSRGRAQALGTARMLAGAPGDAGARLARVRACTAQDLQRAASRLLVPSRRSVVWVRPAPPGSSTTGGRP